MEGSRTASYAGHCARAAGELLQAADASNGSAQRGRKPLVLAEDIRHAAGDRNKREEQDYSAVAQVQGDLFRPSTGGEGQEEAARWRVASRLGP